MRLDYSARMYITRLVFISILEGMNITRNREFIGTHSFRI